jgi:hypothetical protein
MNVRPIFNVGERATFAFAQQAVADDLGVEVYAKLRVADAIAIDRSGISNEEYSYALKAHFDVLVARDNLPILAIEFDGAGHNPKNDHLKNRLCDRFGLPLVRVGMVHINSKNFEDSAVHFLIWQLFGVDAFIEQIGDDPNEAYDPMCFVSWPGKGGLFPFHYTARWRKRLVKPFKQNANLFGDTARVSYEKGLMQLAAREGAWVRENINGGFDMRAICGQYVSEGKSLVGTAQLRFHVFGMSGERRENFLQLDPFVMGLAGGEMYEKALAFLDGDQRDVLTEEEVRSLVTSWVAEGFRIDMALNLPSGHERQTF